MHTSPFESSWGVGRGKQRGGGRRQGEGRHRTVSENVGVWDGVEECVSEREAGKKHKGTQRDGYTTAHARTHAHARAHMHAVCVCACA